MSAAEAKYNSWTKAGLVSRIVELEAELKRHGHFKEPPTPQPQAPPSHGGSSGAGADASAGNSTVKKAKTKGKMDPSKYSTRFIALKLAYLGKRYGGYEYSSSGVLPSIEEELWKALTRAHLIFPTQDERIVDFDCCEYAKCGRTDRGVSAFGQVISLRVRSAKPLPKKQAPPAAEENQQAQTGEQTESPEEEKPEVLRPFDPVHDELDYPRLLNRLLPDDIRILAWCPSPPPGFSARFSCGERQYRYFFTQPAFMPLPQRGGSSRVKTGWLDVEAMRDAARRFEGTHDFRNFCKIDMSKQISEFVRVIYESDIEEVEGDTTNLPFLQTASLADSKLAGEAGNYPKVYSFNVKGSAFLWHQIRHMVAILFLVGQGLESPSIVTELLDIKANPARPGYVMAHESPLVLSDCIFPSGDRSVRGPDAIEWVYSSGNPAVGMFGKAGLFHSVWETWRGHKTEELLSSQLLKYVAARAGDIDGMVVDTPDTRLAEGAPGGRHAGSYQPIMKMAKLETPEVMNERYAQRRGFANSDAMRASKGKRKLDEDTADE
ncbi:hypothetical protein S7711_06876 [Stachybotrys chartarum IBT 7711]|uniref:Pseudouridine synthase I TruA alpha/beta domain-containing protein n=1 Tax=Stachybotrys chartarum (strain CBS 109288 / IBT 7711) TaxID=1280523 RepID=A0A084ANP6_STACB|nr:hypothetical protein S7711_06876 [Stachybotrys chartarum IBT 7711]